MDSRLRYLPEITGQAIMSIDWPTRLIAIGKKYGLHIDDMESFQEVVLKSMLGIIDPDRFESSLLESLALSPANLDAVIDDVNDAILEPIHDFVMNQGKPSIDPLKQAGITIPQMQPESIPVSVSSLGATSRPIDSPLDIFEPIVPTKPIESVIPEPLSEPVHIQLPETTAISSDQEPLVKKLMVPGNYEDFFVHKPVITDHSL